MQFIIAFCFAPFAFFFFAIFKLAGWPTRPVIARGSQWVPKDLDAISKALFSLYSGIRFFVRLVPVEPTMGCHPDNAI